ncbi:MAG TPA: pyridoxal-dependent decarboxylase, partial [Candidatus Limnocylindria bacterium]|nr:pyridoxal-dependent decarboxylase [Candidatus Limnocylindria bacterium]
MDEREAALRRAAEIGFDYLSKLPERAVGARADAATIASRLGDLADEGMDPTRVVEELATAVDPGLVGSLGPRYFGFVIGGQLPASAAADWLTAAWGQNAALHASSPAGAAVEQVAGRWMLDLLGLPADASFGLPTGAGLGNTVGLAAARHAVLARHGWDVEARGLYNAPEITVVVGEEAHATLSTALQYLGLGRERVVRVPVDDQGAMLADAARDAIVAVDGPLIVAIQAGNVNSGAFDPAATVADAVASHPNAWVHVDGAFGLWAAVSPSLRHLVEGVDRADSWSTDAHKWLNVGYDCGFVAVRDATAQRAAMSGRAPYLMQNEDQRDGWEFVLDSSRRARGFVVYAALRSLGRSGVRAMVERCCALARRMADRLGCGDGVEILNDVVLNQVLVRFTPSDGGDGDAFTRAVMGRVQEEGEAWMGGTTWQGKAAIRISVSNWSTTEADIDRTAEAILRAAG